MPRPPLLAPEFVQFLRAERTNVVPFIGAGLSVEAGIPAADPLALLIAERANDRGAVIDVRPDFAEVCAAVTHAFGQILSWRAKPGAVDIS